MLIFDNIVLKHAFWHDLTKYKIQKRKLKKCKPEKQLKYQRKINKIIKGRLKSNIEKSVKGKIKYEWVETGQGFNFLDKLFIFFTGGNK